MQHSTSRALRGVLLLVEEPVQVLQDGLAGRGPFGAPAVGEHAQGLPGPPQDRGQVGLEVAHVVPRALELPAREALVADAHEEGPWRRPATRGVGQGLADRRGEGRRDERQPPAAEARTAFERRREVDAAAERQHGVREAGRQDDAVHRPEQRPQGQRVRGVGRSREAVPLQRAEQRLRAEPTLRTTACAKGDDLPQKAPQAPLLRLRVLFGRLFGVFHALGCVRGEDENGAVDPVELAGRAAAATEEAPQKGSPKGAGSA
mmetsp:Transcript_36778/g.104710  ORF Transcript_36778/g.104710 Transcript_36778/m.104710 type:complete len:261 (-) Transcript_36778:83-865(-)